MAVVQRLKGNTLPVFRLSAINGGSASASFDEEAISINLGDGEGEKVTFADFANGEAAKAFEAEFVYSGDTGSAFDILWSNAGKTANFVWGPHGNAVAAAGKPTFSGALTLPSKPNLETEGSESDPLTFSVTIQIDSITRNKV